MPDFTKLLGNNVADVKRPPDIPMGDYKARISSYTFGESARKKTPYVRFVAGFTGEWPDDVPESDRAGIELASKSKNVDFYLTEDSLFRLADFLKSLGLASGTMEENLPKTVGAEVIVHVVPQLNQETGESFSQAQSMTGA